MDFFGQQDRARAGTTKLVVLYVLAVLAIVIAVNGVVLAGLWVWYGQGLKADTARFADANRASPAPLTEPPTRWELEQLGYTDREIRDIHANYAAAQRRTAQGLDDPPPPPEAQAPGTWWWHPKYFAMATLGTLVVIGGGSLVKSAQLAGGGKSVAEMLGGRPLNPAASPHEKQLQNIVEEMSIASGMPVPQVYVMDNEPGINAFAAGFTQEDAVVGVTQGCLQKLNRDELQGVVAHEFSHILNGDMRLNIRMIGINFGILVIGVIGLTVVRTFAYAGTGSGRRRSSSNDKGSGVAIILVIIVAGLALAAIGYIGVLFGRLIQAAVSRQREYLADASAVQFTRNPEGIAGALKKIGGYETGSKVRNSHAEEAAHMFFGSSRSGFTRLFASHPPLEERIKALDPSFAGNLQQYDESQTAPVAGGPRAGVTAGMAAGVSGLAGGPPPLPAAAAAARGRQHGSMDLTPGAFLGAAGRLDPEHVVYAGTLLQDLPEDLRDAAHEPFSARGIICCLLLDDADAAVRARQQAELERRDPPLAYVVSKLHARVRAQGREARLALLEISMPALRALSESQVRPFMQTLRELIRADAFVSLFEFACFRMVQHATQARPRQRSKYMSVRPLAEEIGVALSALVSTAPPARRSAAAGAAARQLPGVSAISETRPPFEALDAALTKLADASPGVKRRILDAAAAAVLVDGTVEVEEAELLRAFAATLDVPMPPIIGQVMGDQRS
ncbi:MAG: M48 family metallopeptidase [Phycisphaerae bacterium]